MSSADVDNTAMRTKPLSRPMAPTSSRSSANLLSDRRLENAFSRIPLGPPHVVDALVGRLLCRQVEEASDVQRVQVALRPISTWLLVSWHGEHSRSPAPMKRIGVQAGRNPQCRTFVGPYALTEGVDANGENIDAQDLMESNREVSANQMLGEARVQQEWSCGPAPRRWYPLVHHMKSGRWGADRGCPGS